MKKIDNNNKLKIIILHNKILKFYLVMINKNLKKNYIINKLNNFNIQIYMNNYKSKIKMIIIIMFKWIQMINLNKSKIL
jgi:hypothetical protein